MRGLGLSWLPVLVLLGCYSPSYRDGNLGCTASGQCPRDYHCAANRTCWRNGRDPDADAASFDGAASDVELVAETRSETRVREDVAAEARQDATFGDLPMSFDLPDMAQPNSAEAGLAPDSADTGAPDEPLGQDTGSDIPLGSGGTSGSGGSADSLGTGGATGLGGVVAAGGASGNNASGGIVGAGGIGTGGNIGTGGLVSTGGTIATGGLVGTGGNGTGGVVATGGLPSSGGATSCGDAACPPGCIDVSTIPADTYTRMIDSYGQYLVFMLGNHYGTLKVVDMSTPAVPTEKGSLALDFSSGCSYAGSVKIAPGGNYAYIYGGTSCYGLSIIDITDRANPTPVAKVLGAAGGAMDIDICGSRLYMATQSKGVAAFEISTPGAPVLQGEANIAGTPYPYGVTCWTQDATTDFVYLGDSASTAAAGLRVFEYNKTTHVFTARGTYVVDSFSSGGRGRALSSNQLFMMWASNQLALFDVSNKDQIPAPTTFDGEGDPNTDLLISGNLMFTAYNYLNIGIFDVSNPSAPSLIASKPVSKSVVGLTKFSIGSDAYLSYTGNGGTTIATCRLVGI